MPSAIPQQILQILQQTLAKELPPVQLHEPLFNGNEWVYVKECIDTGWVSSAGAYVDKFEHWLKEYTGAAGAVAVVNGTCGLTAALTLNGVKAGSEVLVPAISFAATANAAAHLGAIPHFVEIEQETFGISASKLEEYLETTTTRTDGRLINKDSGRVISALILVHVFGISADIAGVQAVCERFNIPLIEDAAEALGSFSHERHLGTFGETGVLSFNGNKTITTGGGGALLFKDAKKAQEAKHLTNTAKQPHPWAYVHDQAGYNYRMPNINAALGLAQAEQLHTHLQRKEALAESYMKAFSTIQGVRFVQPPSHNRTNFWLNTLVLDDHQYLQETIELAIKNGYNVRPLWTPLHTLPMYTENPQMKMPVAESLAARTLNLPSGPKIISAEPSR